LIPTVLREQYKVKGRELTMTVLLYMKIAEKIEDYILDNNIPAGTKLPSERKLAKEYYVSRNVIREALHVLEKREVIELISSKGAFVTHNGSGKQKVMLKLLFLNNSRSFLDCIEIRETLEKMIVEKVIEYLDDEKLTKLEEIYAKMDQYTKERKTEQFLKYDAFFHKQIASFIPNRTYYLLLDALFNIAPQDFFSFNKILADPFEYSHHDHRILIDALRSRNQQSAIDAVSKMMDNVRQKLMVLLEIPPADNNT